jgi:putative nucleotidyltransferase with HDIG domain
MEKTALKILQQLRGAGHQAFWVGGCVRDLLMGQSPKDYDIATDARPEQVMALFPRTIPVGAKFGVVLVSEGGHSIEVSTFRCDGIYDDGRHPNLVVYSHDPREDVLRRDFTINGMLFDPLEEKVLDFVDGQSDLQNKIVRAIGNPRQRFREDRLRLMRAVRFAARFQFQIEIETRLALEEQAEQVLKVSPERIREELLRILCEGYASRGIRLLEETKLLGSLLPEVAAMRGIPQPPEFHPEGDVWEHTLLLLDYMDQTMHEHHPNSMDGIQPYPGITLPMGALLHDIGKPRTFQQLDRVRFNRHAEVGAGLATAICLQLRFSNRERERIVALVQNHLKFIDWPRMKLSTQKRFVRIPGFEEHLELHRLDCLSSHGNLATWFQAHTMWRSTPPEMIRPQRLLTGDDLLEMGYLPGPVFQKILHETEDAQLEGTLQTREEAIAYVRANYQSRLDLTE